MKKLILFVCTGNVCRSPMAAALFTHRAAQAGESDVYEVVSAGTWALRDQPATEFAGTMMRQRGLTLQDHRGRTVDAELIERAALILVMTRDHFDAIRAEFPSSREKIHLMSEFVGQQYDITDPYGQPIEAYAACATELARLIDTGYQRVDEWLAAVREPNMKAH